MKNHRGKRILAALLALTLALAVCPVIPKAEAAEAPATDVCPCCGKAFSSIQWTEVGDGWFDSIKDLSKAGHYRITKAFTTRIEHSVSSKVVIDFNGYLLQTKDKGRGFNVKSGGMLTFVNLSSGANGRLENKSSSMSGNGATIQVLDGGTLNLYGGKIVGTKNSANGGTIYNDGTVNIAGGTVTGGTVTSTGNGGNIYNRGVLNIYSGTVTGGTAESGNGGNIYNDGDMNLYGGAITSGVATAGSGGNIFNSFLVTMEGGTVSDGIATSGYGGNICNGINGAYCGVLMLHGGTIKNGTAMDGGNLMVDAGGGLMMYGGTISDGNTSGNGGNICATGAATVFKIFGGTVSAGIAAGNSGNLRLEGGVQAYIYGGSFQTGLAEYGGNLVAAGSGAQSDGTYLQSGVYILGGTFTGTGDMDICPGGTGNFIEIYNCRYNGTETMVPFAADCCCIMTDETGCTVWNVGYKEGTCTDCLYAQAVAEGLVTPIDGGHQYVKTDEYTYTCSGCGKVRIVEKVVCTVDGVGYSDLSEALQEAALGAVVKLEEDLAVTTLAINGATLDLNGFTLTADTVTAAAAGNIIDSSAKTTGKLLCSDVTLAESNENLPVTYEDSIRFCPVDFTQWIEPVDVNTTKVKFYFTQRDKETLIDDAILAGNTEVDVQIHLTWTSADGTAQEKTVSFGPELVKKYAEKWNGRVFVTTITGTSNITDLQVAYQVSSTAASGVTLSGSTIKAAGYIHENLTWEQINSYPIKTTDMTVEEMRQLCLDFMVFNKTFLWTPDQSVKYIRNSAGTADEMNQGQIYGGLPYVGVASGNPYRMMDYINPETGLVDMQKALPLLGTKDQLAYTDLKYFGSQCSECVYWAWGRIMNSADYMWTSSAVPNNNFVILGDVAIPAGTASWNKTYGTDECVAENGEQTMFESYALLQKADGMVYYTTAGHLIMAYSDPVVVRNQDGTINGDESYIYIIDQAQTWEEATNASGDTYLRKKSVNAKKTFTQLFASSYIPFTFKEFLGTDPIEVTEVSLVKGSTTYAKGTVSEADRSFRATKTTNSLTWSNLMASSVTSNYGIVDAYIIIKDNFGNENYKHAVRTDTAGNKNLALEETGEMVTVWETKALPSGKTYKAEIVVQLSTGERPTIWNGELTMDN